MITSPANHGAVHPRFHPRRKSSILFSLCLSFLHKRSSALCQIVLSLFLVSVLTKLGTHLLSTSFLCDANILKLCTAVQLHMQQGLVVSHECLFICLLCLLYFHTRGRVWRSPPRRGTTVSADHLVVLSLSEPAVRSSLFRAPSSFIQILASC